jgi:hypothetical protein
MRRRIVRRNAALLFCASVLCAQLYFVVNAYHDPLKRFGFQPFAESSIWRAHIDAVDGAGRRRDIQHGFEGYSWSKLVRERVTRPFDTNVANSGVESSLYFLQRALDYVADHTPRDHSTRYFEAQVWFRKNRGPVEERRLRSKLRDVP